MIIWLIFLIYVVIVIWYWKRKPLKKYEKVILITPIILILLWQLVITQFIMLPTKISGDDMTPNYINGQLYMINMLAPADQLKRGDVIIFRAKDNPDSLRIKRVIGLPGEKVIISNGKVLINDSILNESYPASNTKTQPGDAIKEEQALTIPANQFFVLGDNRDQSKDSRLWGTLPKENIIGTIWFRYH